MKKPAAILVLVLLAAVFTGVVLDLFRMQFEGGDVYPSSSTLRSDPSGAQLLFESLSAMPGMTVVRNYQPLLGTLPDRDSAILLLGLDPRRFAMEPAESLSAFEEFAGRGNRLILAMHAGSGRAPLRRTALEMNWGVRFGLEFDDQGNDVLYFAEAGHWEILERNGQRPVVIERTFGKGSIVLVAPGWLFDNPSVAEAHHTALVARILGAHTRIVFDEAHLGIVESGSIVAMIRRFRLQGMALGLALCAGLFIWKNASSFPPLQQGTATEPVSGRTSAEGLVTLLRRHIPPDRLVSACWQEWLKSNGHEISPELRSDAEALMRRLAGRPEDALREVQNLLVH